MNEGKRIRLLKPAFPLTADEVTILSLRAVSRSAFRALRFSAITGDLRSIHSALIRIL